MREMRDYQEIEKEIGIKEYQKEFLEDDSKIVIGNYPRGGGKTFLLVNKILKEKPREVLFISWSSLQGLKSFEEKIKELEQYLYNYIKDVRIDNNNKIIKINWCDLTQTIVYFKSFLNIYNKNEYYDIIAFNDILPQLDLKAKKYYSVVTLNGISNYITGLRKDIGYHSRGINTLIKENILNETIVNNLYNNTNKGTFIREIDILNEYEPTKKDNEFNKLEVINNQIQELYEEYMSIEKTEKTTIRRDKVLMQIRMLEDMKSKYCID